MTKLQLISNILKLNAKNIRATNPFEFVQLNECAKALDAIEQALSVT